MSYRKYYTHNLTNKSQKHTQYYYYDCYYIVWLKRATDIVMHFQIFIAVWPHCQRALETFFIHMCISAHNKHIFRVYSEMRCTALIRQRNKNVFLILQIIVIVKQFEGRFRLAEPSERLSFYYRIHFVFIYNESLDKTSLSAICFSFLFQLRWKQIFFNCV